MAETSIDDLPEGLLVQILSFLPTIDAIRASLLSSKWRNLWHHVPTLNFDMSLYHSPSNHLHESRQLFADFITQTLTRRPNSTPLDSFRLLFSYRYYCRSQFHVDSWTRRAIASRAAILRLSFSEEDMFINSDNVDGSEPYEKYDFHFSDLKNPCSVKVLELNSCRIVWPKSLSPGGFSSLVSVTLCDVSLRDQLLFAMVSSCINLEFLCLRNLHFLRNFKIFSSTLKKLELGFYRSNVGSLDIHAPNLSKISFDCFSVAKYYCRDLSSLVEARFVFDRAEEDYEGLFDILLLVSGVERLVLQNMRLNLDLFLQVFDTKGISESPPFKNLKYLELQTGYTECELVGIAAFVERCPDLETLVLDYFYKTDDSLSEEFKSDPIILHIPSLKQVKMKSYNGTEKEMYFVELLKTHKVVLRNIVAFAQQFDERLLSPVVLLDKCYVGLG